MTTFFTADLHFGCDNLVRTARKEFDSTEQHDTELLDAINRVVGRNDRLVILGDFCHEKPGRYRPKLVCRHNFFILGNHDKEKQIRAVFGGNVWMAKMVKLKRGMIWCSHYPHSYWPQSHYGAYHAYGHIHYNLDYEYHMRKAFSDRRALDVGVDHARAVLGEYRPFSEDEFFDILRFREGHDHVKPWKEQ